MDKPIERPFKEYSNLILGRSARQGIYLKITQPCEFIVFNGGPHPKHLDTMRMMILCPDDVQIIRAEIAPPIAQEMVREIELRMAISTRNRHESKSK